MPKPITLTTDTSLDVTGIPNLFIDNYLPRANGEFLKIYLYLLRWMPDSGHSLSLDNIADTLCMTENDVIRALKYWENEGLLSLAFEHDGSLSGIRINSLTASAISHSNTPANLQTASAESVSDTHPSYPMQQILQFQSSSGGEQLIFIIQQYLGHPLSPTDLNTIYYFYDDLGFSTDLIEYLFEYCVSNGHTHMRYIEKVALSWSAQNIQTADEARAQSEAHQRSCFAVLKAFGLGGRMPTSGEVDYIRKWTRTYGFSLEMILEACRRTMMTVHTPSFEYTDKILSNWKAQNAYTMNEVLALDKAHSQSKAAAASGTASSRQAVRTPRPANNKFHNFKQRSYDYEALEKKLSQKIQNASGDAHSD
jgi:DnaD/phage-associated family protein